MSHFRAEAAGRSVRIIINPMIICRPTEAEAWRHYHDIADAADPAVLDAIMRRYGSADTATFQGHDRARRAVGGNVQIVGSPQEVVTRLAQLKAAGCDGVQISFFDFERDLDYFGSAVLPLLHEAGLRL